MSALWVKNVITNVHYDSQRSRIESVYVREYLGTSLSSPVVYSRQNVINLIEAGNKFVTATLSMNTWYIGEDVRVVSVRNGSYLRTDNNQNESDNLGNLPEF